MTMFECQFLCVLKGYSCNFLRYNESSQECIWGKVSKYIKTGSGDILFGAFLGRGSPKVWTLS